MAGVVVVYPGRRTGPAPTPTPTPKRRGQVRRRRPRELEPLDLRTPSGRRRLPF
ncbi:MAG TPA: hypothetical protein VFN97_02380 [Actinospica sp.]|nr:hypothetical protein [Actinospica sp.]